MADQSSSLGLDRGSAPHAGTSGADMDGTGSTRLRGLPSVSDVLNAATASALLDRFGRIASTRAVRAALDDARKALRAGAPNVPGAADLADQALITLDGEARSGLRPCLSLPAQCCTRILAAHCLPRRQSRLRWQSCAPLRRWSSTFQRASAASGRSRPRPPVRSDWG
jgi:hypothetical protein